MEPQGHRKYILRTLSDKKEEMIAQKVIQILILLLPMFRIDVSSNFIRLKISKNKRLCQHLVTFVPDVDDKRVRFRLIKRIEDVIGHVRQVFPKNKDKDTYNACCCT